MTTNLYIHRKVPFLLFEINLLKATDRQLLEISRELGLALSLQEMKAVKNYFLSKKRNATDV